jgi:hypothetical protein
MPITCKFLGSILHYLTREAFSTSPPLVKDTLALMNYYRNYHIKNEAIEKSYDNFHLDYVGKDKDELSDNLISIDQLNSYFKLATEDVKIMKSWIYSWGINIGKFIRNKFRKFDKNTILNMKNK